MVKRRRSALESFDGCPHKYNQVVNLGVNDQGDESHRGVAFHEVHFRYIDRLAQAGLTQDKGEADLAFQEGIALSQLPVHILDEVARLWRRHSERWQLDLDAYLAAEERQETERFTWIPDLVYVRPQGIEILDWKTYYKGLTDQQARREFQLKFYLLQAMEIWPGFPSYTFTFVFVRIGYQVSVTLTPDEIEAFRPEVESIVLALEEAERTQNWPAIAGSHCTLCRLACPLVDNPARLPIRLTTKAEAVDAAGQILTLEQRLKVLKKSLNGWCNQEGPLFVKGQEFLHVPVLSKSYPAKLVLERLVAKYGEGADTGLMISGSAVKKADPLKVLLNAKGVVDADLADKESTRQTWPFKHRKSGGIGDPDKADGDEDDDGE